MIKRICLYTFLLLFFLGSSAFAASDDIEIKADVNKSEITIGDNILYKVTVKTDKATKVEFVSLGNDFGVFAVKDFGTKEKSFWHKKTIEKWFLLDTYVTGEYEIKGGIVNYTTADGVTDDADIPIVKVNVHSILKEDKLNNDIKDIYGPLLQRSNLLWLLLIVSFLILLTVIILIWHHYLLRKNTKETIIRKPAYEIAYEELEKLRGSSLIQQGLIKEYYFRLSQIVRHYLENRFNVKAPEMTTEEFLKELKEKDILKTEQKVFLKDFLVQADMVKFAKYGPDQTEIEMSFSAAKKLVDETKEDKEEIKKYDL